MEEEEVGEEEDVEKEATSAVGAAAELLSGAMDLRLLDNGDYWGEINPLCYNNPRASFRVRDMPHFFRAWRKAIQSFTPHCV